MKKRSNSSTSGPAAKKVFQTNSPRNPSKEILPLKDHLHSIEESKTGISSSQNSSYCSNLPISKYFVISGPNYSGIVYPQGIFLCEK